MCTIFQGKSVEMVLFCPSGDTRSTGIAHFASDGVTAEHFNLDHVFKQCGVFCLVRAKVGVDGDFDIFATMLAEGGCSLPVLVLLGKVEPFACSHHSDRLGVGDEHLEVDFGEACLAV